MPIVRCPNAGCATSANIPAELGGRHVRCRNCSSILEVPSSTDEPPPLPPIPLEYQPTPTAIGRFRIRRPLGEGGFGKVYLAFDPQLDREVALKVPRAGTLNSEQRVRRFREDARSAAQLRHPHIVPVYDAGEAGGQHFIASAFVEGGTLARAIDADRFEIRRAVEVVRHLAEALAYAHGQGVVHRDVKPANILLDGLDEPHLIDFGLAHRGPVGNGVFERAEESEEGSADESLGTRVGAVLGTAMYMSPEQASGRAHEASPAMDQYSLGIVLYELLTGKPPFCKGTGQAICYHHVSTPIPSPCEARPEIDPDLEAICLKCLEKNPRDRYTSCAHLAEDLRRWLRGEFVSVRSPGPTERLLRWVRDQPVLAGAALVTTLCLLLVVGIMAFSSWRLSWQAEQERLARGEAESAKSKEEDARLVAEEETRQKKSALEKALEADQLKGKALADALKAEEATQQALATVKKLAESEKAIGQRLDGELRQSRRNGYFNSIALAERELRDFQIGRAQKLLADAEKLTDAVGWEWHHLMGECSRTHATSPALSAMAFRPMMDGTRIVDDWLAWGNDNNQVVLRRRVTTPKANDCFLLDAPGPVRCLAFSGDGNYLAAGCANDKVVVWSFRTTTPLLIRQYDNVGAGVTAVALDRTGTSLLYGLADGRVTHVENIAQPSRKFLPREHFTEVRSLAFDPLEEKAVSVCRANRMVMVVLQSNEIEMKFESITALAIHPMGTYTFLAKEGGRIVTYALNKTRKFEEVVQFRDHESDVQRLVGNLGVSGLGDRVASLDREGLLRVWEVSKNKSIIDHGTSRAVGSFALNRLGDEIAWVAEKQTVIHRTFGSRSEPRRYQFRNGQNVGAGVDGPVLLEDHAEYTHGLAYSKDSTRLVSACSVAGTTSREAEAGEMLIWNLADRGKQQMKYRDENRPLWTVDISKRGQIAYGGQSAILSVLEEDLRQGPALITSRGYEAVNLVRFSPTGDRLASAHTDGKIHVWNPSTRERVAELTPNEDSKNVLALAWNGDGERLVCGDDAGNVTWWTDLKQKVSIAAHTGRVWSVVVLKVGEDELVASAGEDGTIKLWKMADRSLVLTLRGHGLGVLALAVSPDGTRLASAGRDNSIRLWEVGTWREVLAIGSKVGLRSGLAFRPDGRELAVATVQGVLRLDATPARKP